MPLDTGGSVADLVFGPEIQLSLVSRSWTTVAAASPPPINFTFRVWGLGCPDSRAIMLGFRASRIGLLILKQLTRDKSICRPTYATRSFTQFLQPLYNQQSGTRLFRGAIFQKHHHFSTTTASTSDQGTEQKETISVTFVDKDGDEKHIKVPIGMSMLEAAHENDIELEGACEGSLACSTCHVIVMEMEYYNKLEDPTDEENDMLDLAFGLTETSRLGCQVIASPELDGVRLAIPAATRNFAVDGYVPKPH